MSFLYWQVHFVFPTQEEKTQKIKKKKGKVPIINVIQSPLTFEETSLTFLTCFLSLKKRSNQVWEQIREEEVFCYILLFCLDIQANKWRHNAEI